MTPERKFGRRALLLGSASAVVLAGCSSGSGRPATGASASASRGPAGDVRELIAQPNFVVAHRGSGDNWPEHSLTAYKNGLAAGAAAVEISVRRSADNVLVCHHDADTSRVTGIKGLVADATYAELKERPIDARRWLGGATPLEEIPRLVDVLEALPQDCMIFIEDKDGDNTDALLNVMDKQPNATGRFVWKQWAAANQVGAARNRGYLSWGYFTSDIFDRLDELAPRHDALGVPMGSDDSVMQRFVASGKPVIAWEVHTRSERDRLSRLRVAGAMCSNVPYVTTDVSSAWVDAFASGQRAAGDLPGNVADGWSSQPAITAGVDSLTLAGPGTPRYLLGSLAPVTADIYSLTATIAWKSKPSSQLARAGLTFGLDTDAAYHPQRSGVGGGYQLYIDAAGDLSLGYQAPGSDFTKVLTSLKGVAKSGRVDARVDVNPQQLVVRCNGKVGEAIHMDARGGYLWLWGELVPAGVSFSGIRVSRA